MNQSRSEKEFVGMIRQHERIIYKVCSFYVSVEHPVADLYQEVVCNLWQAFHKFRNECSVSTWVYRIALNTCISGIRKGKNHLRNIPLSAADTELFIEPEDMEGHIRNMYQLIYRLKELERAIILLYLEDRSYQEIADITGLTLSNVATKLNRIKEKLKQMSGN